MDSPATERDATIQKIVTICKQQTAVMEARRNVVALLRTNEEERDEALKPYATVEASLLKVISLCDTTLQELKGAFQVHSDSLTSKVPGA